MDFHKTMIFIGFTFEVNKFQNNQKPLNHEKLLCKSKRSTKW